METQVNRDYLGKLLENPNITKMNMLEVVQYVYDATYIRYMQKFYQEKMHRETQEERTIEKNKEIDRLTGRIAQLVSVLDANGIAVPEESSGEAQTDT